MKILLTGASGFIGTALVRSLLRDGHSLVLLQRDVARAQASLGKLCEIFSWNALEEKPPLKAFHGVDAVIHLAGESIASGRWTAARKASILNSRVLGTRHLLSAIEDLGTSGPRTFISASAIGYYGDRGDEIVDESSPPGTGFLSEVVQAWEAEVFRENSKDLRRLALRFGMVLGRSGGALETVEKLFCARLGGRVGSGKQWVSWIHLDDLMRLISFCLKQEKMTGVFNALAPQPVTNAEFTEHLAKALDVRAALPAPAFALKAVLGEMSTLLLGSQRVSSQKVQSMGFTFEFPTLERAFHDLFKKS